MRRRLWPAWLIAIGVVLLAGPLRAHIGSTAAIFDGVAGTYPVRVIVQPPPVVPGRALIDVRLLTEKTDDLRVTVLPVSGRAGLDGAPSPDEAKPVEGEPALRHAELWLMTPGAYSVHVSVSGPRGAGTAIVPVMSMANQRLGMSPWLGGLLAFLALLLFSSAVALTGKAVSDSVRPDDTPLTPQRRRVARIVTAVAAVAFASIVYGGMRWWTNEDQDYRNNRIYRPDPMDAVYQKSGDAAKLALAIKAARGTAGRLQLLPDHGKLMHLFLVREPQLDSMAHLHPVRTGARAFEVALPAALPPGHYQLYADITYESAFSATLTAGVEIPEGAADVAGMGTAPGENSAPVAMPTTTMPMPMPKADKDDSWYVGGAGEGGMGGASGAAKPDLTVIRLNPQPLRAGEDVSLGFALRDAAGQPVIPDAYMGMLGHAAIRRADGTVFAHIHPAGTISMASEAYFVKAAAKQTGALAPGAQGLPVEYCGPGGEITFPYLFPQPGPYRIWVQMKKGEKVVTGAFDVEVAARR